MIVSMHDPDSIIAWLKVWPARHYLSLEDWMKTSPTTVPAIMEAQRRLASDPDLAPVMQELLRARRQRSGIAALMGHSYKPEEAAVV